MPVHSAVLDLLERGVYTAPFLSTAGTPLLVGVTSSHRFVGFLPYTSPTEKKAAKAALWAMLNEADPVRQLKLG